MGKFIIKENRSGQFEFQLKAGNGQPILRSKGHNTKSSCQRDIGLVKENAPHDHRYIRHKAESGHPFFDLQCENGRVIASSELYSQTTAMENGIKSVKSNAPMAEVLEQLEPFGTGNRAF